MLDRLQLDTTHTQQENVIQVKTLRQGGGEMERQGWQNNSYQEMREGADIHTHAYILYNHTYMYIDVQI